MRLAEEYEITQLLVMATSALREAPNGNKVIHKIEELIGQGVTVLSGTDEARLTFLAARRWYGWDAGRLLVLDIDGGSARPIRSHSPRFLVLLRGIIRPPQSPTTPHDRSPRLC